MYGDDPLTTHVRRRLATRAGAPDATAVAAAVRERLPVVGSAALLETVDHVVADVVGAGPLEPLLRDPDVTDVLVNGPGVVWVDRGRGVEATDIVFDDDATVRRLAQRIVAASGRRLDDALPYADARLADGTRVHAVLPPLAPGGTCLSLRAPARRTFTLDALVAAGSLPGSAAALLRELVEARLAFVVTGGTGTGKTTVLSTLLSLVSPRERIVLVEDAAELLPTHPHVVRLEARLPNAEGVGGIGMPTLVRQALRMRPDRLVVGEVRGAEVTELLTALNTGHDGGGGTLHANRVDHVPARFEALCASAGLDRGSAHSQLAAALQAVVHLARGRDGRRRVAAVAWLGADDGGLVQATTAYSLDPTGVVAGPAATALRRALDRA